MPGGQYDSSKTRVSPVFDFLRSQKSDWVRQLLQLARGGHQVAQVPADVDLAFVDGYWGVTEKGLRPPISLLSWLIRNSSQLAITESESSERRRLRAGDPQTVASALQLLRQEDADRAWYILEGPTYPDAIIETAGALVVVEGKRTESGPTTKTRWLPGRHQMWRHIDAAWEIRGHRQVYGLFVVESDSDDLPDYWRGAATLTLGEDVLGSSFPHRGKVERELIAKAFLGVATWRRICSAFGLPHSSLPHTV